MANRLASSSSAYLRSAAHQPIDWHEFGEEAFALAKSQDKPILLDIGAVWCHWCHVIDRESYENDEIAALVNQHYIAVKVDRDQRPDVDARYQQVVQSLTGQGGWPLTAFLTHDGRLIYGGTYFPPQAMKNLLNQVYQLYHEKKQEFFGGNETLTDENIRRMEQEALLEARGDIRYNPEEVKALANQFSNIVLESARRMFDATHGGFGSQPKFPHFSALEALILREHRNPSPEVREMIEKTLAHMARGGIYDQIAGGFHRYSVDDHWHVPHFEKMAYDNAEALKVYAQAYRLTGIPLYKEIAEGIAAWVGEWLSDSKRGGFYATQDADINLEDDGDHFTWSPQEVADILSPEEAQVVRRYYDIHDRGDMHHAAGRNVLYVSRSVTDIAHELSLPVAEVERLLESGKAKMLEKRRQRPMPFIDETLYVNWNGMQIAAWFEAADLLGNPDMRDFAERSLNRMLDEFYRAGQRVYHTTGVDGFLEDYAWLALACLKGYYATGNGRYLEDARGMANLMIAHFEDSRQGGFFDTRQEEAGALALLKIKRKPAEDSPSSSANGIALQVFGALAYLLDEDGYRECLERGLVQLINQNGQYGLFCSALSIAGDQYAHPPLKIELAGDVPELAMAARAVFYPGKMLRYSPGDPANEARLCVGSRCLAPVKTAEALRAQVEELLKTAGSAV